MTAISIFQRDIQAIFAERCYECHGVDSREGGLRLTNRRDAFAAADSGDPVLVPGNSQASTLLKRVRSRDESEQMPPEAKRLTSEEIDRLQRWIDAGAPWPKEESAPRHWAYVPPSASVPPSSGLAAVARNPIDAYILKRL